MAILVPISDARERALLGSKAAHLAFMTGLDLRVPPGAVVPADDFAHHADACRRDARAIAAAVVAEGGGLLSHVAIVCREYRIPCVCGCPGALSALAPGQRVRVDGTRGVVELLAAA